jgi:hypothetical protein
LQKRLLIFLAGLGVFLIPAVITAEEPWGEMRAEPNPCRIEREREECTTHITWHTRGVERVKVFVTSVGRKEEKEHLFSTERECEGDRCRAPWISHHTTYTFQLFDFTRGDRGRMLASVTVRGEQ